MNILAIDIGGSAVKYACSDGAGNLSGNGRFPVPATLEELIQQVAELFHSVNAEGLAVSSPGAVDPRTGIVGGISAVPYLHGPSIRERFESVLHAPTEMENDANCAALAELWKGNARQLNDCCFVILGTGIGGAIIKDRKIHRGAHNQAAEFGLLFSDCELDTADYHVWSHYSSVHTVRNVSQESGIPEEQLSGAVIFDEADRNPLYARHTARFYRALAIGLLEIQQFYDPEAILLGGGISARADLIENIYASMDTLMGRFRSVFVIPELRKCAFGNDANLIGAVFHYLSRRNQMSITPPK